MRRLRTIALPWAVCLLGILISLVAWAGLRESGERRLKAAFHADAAERALAIEDRLERNLLAVHALAGLYSSPDEVDPKLFSTFTRSLRRHHAAVQAFEWIPRVSRDERADFEERARDRGFAGFYFRDRQRQGEMIPAPPRTEYFPVYLVEPYEGNETALGFDLASSESRLQAIELARDQGSLAVTDWIVLVQDTANHYGFLALYPIYDTHDGAVPPNVLERRGSLRGFVLGVFRIDDIVNAAVGHLRPLGVELSLVDLSADPDERLLYRSSDAGTDATPYPSITHVSDIEIGGRTWRLTLTPTSGYVGRSLSWLPVVTFWVGLGITALAAGMIVLSAGRSRRVRELVRSRTSDLARANEALEKKIVEHARAEEERRELEAQLHHTHKLEALGRLAGGIAHDFNNLLMGIRFFTEMVRDAMAPEDKSRVKLDRALEATRHATDLVQQIRTFSSSHRTPREPLHMCDVIEDALKLLRPVLPSSIEIRTRLACEEDVVHADATQMHQVLVNLCTNAADAMAGGVGALDLKLDTVDMAYDSEGSLPGLTTGRYVRLSVRDTGAGIAAEHLKHIFEPFFTTKDVGRGTGMGLAVVHGIVTKHGGAIRARSRAGKGTMFQVFLPRATGAKSELKRPDPAMPRGSEHVFLVDDDTVVADVGKELLESRGYTVTVFTRSSEAFDAFRRDPELYDLAILDQVMPHLSGVELARELRLLRPTLPIIICTGYAEEDTMELARGIGVRTILSKSVSPTEYLRAVRAVLEEPV